MYIFSFAKVIGSPPFLASLFSSWETMVSDWGKVKFFTQSVFFSRRSRTRGPGLARRAVPTRGTRIRVEIETYGLEANLHAAHHTNDPTEVT